MEANLVTNTAADGTAWSYASAVSKTTITGEVSPQEAAGLVKGTGVCGFAPLIEL